MQITMDLPTRSRRIRLDATIRAVARIATAAVSLLLPVLRLTANIGWRLIVAVLHGPGVVASSPSAVWDRLTVLRGVVGAWPDTAFRRLALANLLAAAVLASSGMLVAADRSAVASPVTPPAVAAGPATVTPPAVQVPPPPPPPDPVSRLPYGKGMWIYQPQATEGGRVKAIVARAQAVGLSHLYVRTGSTWDGFNGGPFLAQILPAAHAAGLQVYGWDFPRLISPKADVERALAAVAFTAPGGHHIDGFAADIETPAEGTRITPAGAQAYGDLLRQGVGPDLPLLAVVPRPSPERATFPYAEAVSRFDAIAPMVYWLNREPGSDVAGALAQLGRFGKPVFPVGQAYDGRSEGGRPGVPPRAELLRFTQVAAEKGAAGVSFWSWQEANQQAWDAIRDAPQFRRRVIPPPVGAIRPSPSRRGR